MNNRPLEDMLEEMAGYGQVELTYTKFVVNASNAANSGKDKWRLRYSMPGYDSKYGTEYVEYQGSDVYALCQKALAWLEDWYHSPAKDEARERYLENWKGSLYRSQSEFAKVQGFHHPHPIKPELVWGQPRTMNPDILNPVRKRTRKATQ